MPSVTVAASPVRRPRSAPAASGGRPELPRPGGSWTVVGIRGASLVSFHAELCAAASELGRSASVVSLDAELLVVAVVPLVSERVLVAIVPFVAELLVVAFVSLVAERFVVAFVPFVAERVVVAFVPLVPERFVVALVPLVAERVVLAFVQVVSFGSVFAQRLCAAFLAVDSFFPQRGRLARWGEFQPAPVRGKLQ
jgi:hypothetical protein